MITATYPLCCKCKNPVLQGVAGLRLIGRVYHALHELPKQALNYSLEHDANKIDDVYCRSCFEEMVGWS